MRCDIFLKTVLLVKRRSLAKQLCDKKRVKINGSLAKPSREMKVGDIITLEFQTTTLEVKVLAIPTKKNVSRAAAPEYYEIIATTKHDDLFA